MVVTLPAVLDADVRPTSGFGNVDVFRLKTFEIAIIISPHAREKLEAVGATGMKLVDGA